MMKIGLIGCGRIARQFHIPSIKAIPYARIVAISDKKKSAIKKVSSMLNGVNCYTYASDLLTHEDLDMVDICTPGFTHYELCLEAIENGLHVIVEKPLALSLREARDLREKSSKRGVNVCVMQDFRFKDNVLEVKKAWEEGRLGKIIKVSSIHHGVCVYNEPSWLWNEQKSGGILYELGIHTVDLQAYFCGEHEEILAINTHYQKSLNYMTGLEALIKYKSGAIGILDITQDTTLHSALFNSLNIYGTGSDAFLKFYPEYLRFSSGTVYPLEEFTIELRRMMRFGSLLLRRKFKSYREMSHKRVIQGFIDAVREGGKMPVSIDDVMNTMRLLESLKEKSQDFVRSHFEES